MLEEVVNGWSWRRWTGDWRQKKERLRCGEGRRQEAGGWGEGRRQENEGRRQGSRGRRQARGPPFESDTEHIAGIDTPFVAAAREVGTVSVEGWSPKRQTPPVGTH